MRTHGGTQSSLGWIRDEEVDRILYLRAACGWGGGSLPPTSPTVAPDADLSRALGPHPDWRRELHEAASGAVSRLRRPEPDEQIAGVVRSAGFRAWLAERARRYPTTTLREAFPSVQRVQAAAWLTDDEVFHITVLEVPVEGRFAEIVSPDRVLASPDAVVDGDLIATLAECAVRQQR